jgi:hypothetical protein
MAKKRTSFSISDEALELLKKLAEKNDRSQANMAGVVKGVRLRVYFQLIHSGYFL